MSGVMNGIAKILQFDCGLKKLNCVGTSRNPLFPEKTYWLFPLAVSVNAGAGWQGIRSTKRDFMRERDRISAVWETEFGEERRSTWVNSALTNH